MRIVFLGLGTMGLPMACALARAGHEVVGWNRNRTRVAGELDRLGFAVAEDLGSVAASADAICLMLWDGTAVDDVLWGPHGVVASRTDGCLIVDHSTTSPDFARETASRLEAQGFAFVDAPVTGGVQAAREGRLSVMAGGPQAACATASGLLEGAVSRFARVGDSGAGQLTKLANNVLGFLNIVSVLEATNMLTAGSVDTDAAAEVLSGGTGASAAWDLYAARVLAVDFGAGVDVRVAKKDLALAYDYAERGSIELPVVAGVLSILERLNVEEAVPFHALYDRAWSEA